MTNFCNYYCLSILLIYITKSCSIKDFIIDDLELGSSGSVEDSGSSDDRSDSGLQLYQDVCDLPIDVGHCKAENRATHKNDLSGIADQELEVINELYDVKEIYEVSEKYGRKDHFKHRTPFFGYNRNTRKCEEFPYEGCGGNDNRFVSLKKCRKTCYSPLKYFLSEVTDLLLFKIKNSSEQMTNSSEQITNSSEQITNSSEEIST